MIHPSIRRLHVGLAVLLLAVVATSLALSRAASPRTVAGPQSINKVVVFAIPGLSLEDMDRDVVPNLDRLAKDGSIAVANVRIQSDKPNLLGAYASFGAGNKTRAAVGDVQAFPAVDGALVVPTMATITAQVATEGGSPPGSLGDALHTAGRRTAVVSNASAIDDDAAPGASVPAALAVASTAGLVDAGSIGGDLLTQVTLPDGTTRVQAKPRAYARAVAKALAAADVVLVDPGDTTRALAATLEITEEPSGGIPVPAEDPLVPDVQARIDALHRTDAILGRVRSQLSSDELLLVVGTTPPGATWGLTPVVASGTQIPAGYLDSSSTHRPALVTLTDLAPTILEALDAPVPPAMIGTPLRYRRADASWDQARRLDDLLASQASIDRVMTLTFILVQTALYGTAVLLLLGSGVPRRLRPLFELGALACGAWPVSTFLLRLGTSLYSLGPGTFALSWLIAVTLALAAWRLRGHPLDPILAICGLTVATLVLDLSTGSHLQVGSFFGYTPQAAPRYIGLGNPAFAILAGATMVVVVGLVARARDRGGDQVTAWWLAASVAVLVIVADGAPWMGADVGGILAIVPVLALTLWVLLGRRIRWQSLLMAAGLGAIVLGLAVGVEALRSPDQRTHIGRFFLGSGDSTTIYSTLRRKWDANVRTIEQTPGTLLAPILTLLGLNALRKMRPVARVLPAGSPQRVGVIATVAIGTAGWLVNDSGMIVLGLACLQLGPYLLLLTFRGQPADALDAAPATAPRPATLGPPVRLIGARVVAIVAAKDRADTIADTVTSLLALERVDQVLVVDDGSTDATAAEASAAGADVLRLARNRGKGGAVRAGVDHTPDADVYLLIDADLARTAAAADALLDPVLTGTSDLTIGVLPPAGKRGGFGTIRRLSATGIHRATGLHVEAPLSGQRAVRADFLRRLGPAERFGLEVAMTIDVVRGGGRVLEVPVPMDHRHTGRSLGGFAHRGGQGADIVAALWPRLVSRRARLTLVAGSVVVWTFASYLSASAAEPAGQPPARTAAKVVLFGIPELGLGDVTPSAMPNLYRLSEEGAYGMATPRSGGGQPSTAAYATIGAGDRIRSDARAGVGAGLAAESGAPLEDRIVVPGLGELLRAIPDTASSSPGALGDALHDAGRVTAVVANSSTSLGTDGAGGSRTWAPSALGVADSAGSIDHGDVGTGLLRRDRASPFGVSADPDTFVAAVGEAVSRSDVVFVDPGDTDRTATDRPSLAPEVAAAARGDALARTDVILGLVADALPAGTRLVVTGISPAPRARLVPLVIHGAGITRHRLTSPATGRSDLAALTDLAPTVLDSLGVRVPPAMIGQAIRYEPGRPDRGDLLRQEHLIQSRDHVYGPLVNTFVWVIAALYAVTAGLLLGPGARLGGRAMLRWALLTTTAWPLATFVVRGLGPLYDLGVFTHVLVWVIAGFVAAVAGRWRAHPLDPLLAVSALTVAVISIDVATGGHLQTSSYLGYTPSVAARFTGIGNAAFGVYAAAAVVTCVAVVARSSRPADAWWAAAAIAAVAVVVDGAPWLGSDVGGTLSLVPALGLVLVLLAGRRITWRSLIAVGAATAAVLAVAVGIEALRPPDQRTHIGRFFLGGDQSGFRSTILRKWDVNVHLLTSSNWTWLIVIIGVFLVLGRGWWHVTGPASPERAGLVGLLVVTLLGWATNDSGVLVAALVLCFVGPFVVLLALAGRPEEPEYRPAARRRDMAEIS